MEGRGNGGADSTGSSALFLSTRKETQNCAMNPQIMLTSANCNPPPPFCATTSNTSLLDQQMVIGQCFQAKKRRLTTGWSLRKSVVVQG